MDIVKTAVLIAGGEGSRLRPLTDDKPKAMVDVCGKPILYWIINWLKDYGIENIVIGVAYKKEKIIDYLKENNNFGLNVNFSEHTVEGGTAQGFKLAIQRYVKDEDFLAMNADEVTNMDIAKMVELHNAKKPIVTMALAPFHCRFSVVDVEQDNMISGFRYGHKLEDAPISIGIYVFNHKILELIPNEGSIEDDVFAKLAKEKKMIAHMLSEKEEWISINNMKELKEAEEKLKHWGLV